jgi:homocysteine S-methyltransferase
MFNPLLPLLDANSVIVIDGAMATELEHRGEDLSDALWSARLLIDSPELIRAVHLDYLRAGADVLITASYQASIEGFKRRGLNEAQVRNLLRLSVQLAADAIEDFLVECPPKGRDLRPLIAASVGPYGAYLADGSEYRGDYGLSVEELVAWHRPRIEALVATEADLCACETIPCLAEAEALTRLLAQFPHMTAWLSFSCRNGVELSSGERFADAVHIADACEQIVAVGVNCTAPRYIESLIAEAVAVTDKPVLCYPNSGETWDATARCWVEGSGVTDFTEPVCRWYAAGASLIGGCCRTTPADIVVIAQALHAASQGAN